MLLVLPVLVHQLGETAQVALLQRGLALVTELLDEVQVLDHVAVAAARLLVLLGQDGRGRPRVAGEEQQQVVFQVIERLKSGESGAALA